ncbi:MAG: hypothetical protein WA777_02010 [Rhodanobacter sp.]
MHLELPKTRLHSLMDFGKHYLMIVLSILTALGLEAWIEHVHHRDAAATASAQIEAEIRTNLAEIDRARRHDFERMQALTKIRDTLLSDIQAHASDATIYQHVKPDDVYLDWRWPVLRHEAWDVAVANQSASWIDNEQLHRYSAIYAAQNASTAMMTEDLPTVLDGPRMIDAMIDQQMGNLPPRELLHAVNQMTWLASEAAHNLENTAKRINDSLSGNGMLFAHATPAS